MSTARVSGSHSLRRAAIALLALGVGAGCDRRLLPGKSNHALPSGAVVLSTPLPPPLPPPALPAGPGARVPASFADLAEAADPAVVFVKTIQVQRVLTGRRVVGEGLGSGFVYDASGLILTNNHVIENAREISVIFGRTKAMPATVVGRDPPTDVAVLRVDAKELAALPLGDSDSMRVGDWVVAIGNPFGLQHTVSAGILSAKGRTNQDVKGLDEGGYYEFLQTDASINPGNSGGPLLDTGGRVVGINTAIRAEANSIGFAIPINMVRDLLPRLLKDGSIKRSAVGVVVVPVLPDDVARVGLTSAVGALVSLVVPGGPADVAGLKVDDVIVEFDNKPISGPEKLRWMASLGGIGNEVPVKVQRGARLFEVRVKLNALPTAPRMPQIIPFPP